ncbi:hypothetical protein AMATHDRAFT_72908 [Amanita thiersii Skay4041]|uniref:DNA damage-binding protein 1 n=1 Tax=Amanita thiersii Skay4041 TaxID=703135 RepID=A0A2A9NUU6_9AGAR|nr:hypothetical protein AMATHDRAFT_72908 [Amanita thiersii Skay4041]
MKVVTTFHHPSSVLCSVKCCLGSRDTEHLVVGKINRLLVYSIQPHGLQLECSVDVWGKVLTVREIPIPRSSRSNLVLMIAHPDPELVFFTYTESEDGTSELIVKKTLPLYERTPRPAEFFNNILVHPSGQLAIVSCYTGKLKVIKLKAGNYHEDFDVSLPELNVFGITFLDTPEQEYTIAILFIDNKHHIQLHARDILVHDLELSAQPSLYLHPTSLSETVFPNPTESIPYLATVPTHDLRTDDDDDAFRGGVLVFGGRKLLLYELAGKDAQEKQKAKRRRLEARKSSSDTMEAARARDKEKERESRRRKPKASIEWPWSDVTAVCSIDNEPFRHLIGDAYGRLSMLSLDNINEMGLILIPLGETSPATTLTYLTSHVLFVGSHLGDSQVVQISPAPVSFLDVPTLPIPTSIKTVSPSSLPPFNAKGKGKQSADEDAMDIDNEMETGTGCILANKGSHLTVLETHKNIAPIIDATLVDIDGGGQHQILTCSGGRSTGALNIVRTGADYQELACIPGLLNITQVWPVKMMWQDELDSHILVSTLHSTSLFRIGERAGNYTLIHVKGNSLSGLHSDTPTLAFANVARRVKVGNSPATYQNSPLAVQVTPRGVFLLQLDSVLGAYNEVSRWVPEGTAGFDQRGIVAASINASQVVVGIGGGRLVAFSITEKNDFRMIALREGLSEISAVSCTPLDPTRCFTNHIVVSYWGRNIVEIFQPTANGFVSLCKTSSLPYLIRSLLLYNFGSGTSPKSDEHYPHLLVGLDDGSLVTFVWKEKELKEKKLVSLGHAPVILAPCTVDGKKTVLAAGNRATLVSFDKKRLQFSPVSLKDVSAASRYNAPGFSSSLILATPTGLSIGKVGDLDKLHIRTIPFGFDNPRRIVYEPLNKVFGVGCTEVTPARIGEDEATRSSFVLLDETTYREISRFRCEDNEEVTSIALFTLNEQDKSIPLFCVGTYCYDPNEMEPESGRILVFDVTNGSNMKWADSQLSLFSSTSVKGCVYSLVTVGNTIAAAVNSSVELFRLEVEDAETSMPAYKLKQFVSWNHNYIVSNLASFNDNSILVGDQISSISLVKLENKKLKSVARDYGPLWPVSIDASSEMDIICANDALNLYTFSLNRHNNRSFLERNGNWHLADLVTKFVHGSLSRDVEEDAPFKPQELYFTSSGRIGVILDIKDNNLSIHLTALERNMGYVTPAIGGESHTRFRSPKNTRGRTDADGLAIGFLDGDFIEQLLTLTGSQDIVDKIVAGSNAPEKLAMPVQDLLKVVETLQSMH